MLRDCTYASTDTDWGVSFRPWQLFALGIAESPLFVTVNTALDCSAVVIFGCETLVTSVVSYVVRVVHIFDFRLFIYEVRNDQQTATRGKKFMQ